MRKEDILEVSEIEKLSFPSPWSSNIFFSELEKESFAFYHVMEYRDRLVGYGGYWRIKNEAHLVTFAIHPTFRRMGLGAKLLEHILSDIQDKSLDTITLEVRHSNLAAQRFYERFDFKKIAVRPHYYSDTDEDAIVYWKKL
ncbi:MAG: ribosomal protein S18-alanine N-acetyltransferase [bacterium]